MEISVVSSRGWARKKFEGEWAQTLQKFLSKQQEIVPDGWLRSDEALRRMGLMGCASGQRNKLLNRMTEDGFLEKKDFRIFDGSGRRISAITHYRLANNQKKPVDKKSA
ncbi:MAG: hypothetical protein EBU96_05110 [Actinobacteria bacterium]|nr:hypothetical protein [Actinomycetota bacterium]